MKIIEYTTTVLNGKEILEALQEYFKTSAIPSFVPSTGYLTAGTQDISSWSLTLHSREQVEDDDKE